MPDLFAKLDVNYRDDPAIIGVGAEAELVYIRSLVLAKRILSDGHIHHAHLSGLTSDIADVLHGDFTGDDYAKALVEADLWVECADGWIIRTWLEHNQSKAEIDESRESERTRKAKYRQSRKDTELGPTDVPPVETDLSHGTESHARTVETEKSRDREKRRKRRPLSDFSPTDAHIEYATTNGLVLTEERQKWLTWCEANGKTYQSLNAGFTTWLHRAVEYGRGSPPVATLEELATSTAKGCPLGICQGDGLIRMGEYDDGRPHFEDCECRA